MDLYEKNEDARHTHHTHGNVLRGVAAVREDESATERHASDRKETPSLAVVRDGFCSDSPSLANLHIKALFLVVVRTPCSLVQMCASFAGEPSGENLVPLEDGDRTSREKNPELG